MPVRSEAVSNEVESKRTRHRGKGTNAQQEQRRKKEKAANHFTAFISLSLDLTAERCQSRGCWDQLSALTEALTKAHGGLEKMLDFNAPEESERLLHLGSKMAALLRHPPPAGERCSKRRFIRSFSRSTNQLTIQVSAGFRPRLTISVIVP